MPGIAAGMVSRGAVGGAGHVALVTHRQLGPFVERPEALVIVDGAPFSHATITQRALGVPVVLVSAAQAGTLREGQSVVVDGVTGMIRSWSPGGARPLSPPVSPAGRPVRTADGTAVDFHASVHSVQAAKAAVRNGARSIGLVRTEFLVPPAGRRPDQGHYESRFAALCEAAAPLPVTFRLIDIAADKIPAWIQARVTGFFPSGGL
jgi:phosphoenolpyruvate-protein kinase (PTS system EI component)